ncbi:hypothetical protein [Eisenbergiella porci]|uniref:hypothetical protein n=1 Tax=Eisenbergiella porci TaxID=2652274 RepID=UPI002A803F06|nr:hypothetical protein [Eisenbergiella porci]
MKVVSKNCFKKQSKEKQRKSMATVGKNAYLNSQPKIPIEVMKSKKANVMG